jgi:hypothetical protein
MRLLTALAPAGGASVVGENALLAVMVNTCYLLKLQNCYDQLGARRINGF